MSSAGRLSVDDSLDRVGRGILTGNALGQVSILTVGNGATFRVDQTSLQDYGRSVFLANDDLDLLRSRPREGRLPAVPPVALEALAKGRR